MPAAGTDLLILLVAHSHFQACGFHAWCIFHDITVFTLFMPLIQAMPYSMYRCMIIIGCSLPFLSFEIVPCAACDLGPLVYVFLQFHVRRCC